jgi:hypothetical protein
MSRATVLLKPRTPAMTADILCFDEGSSGGVFEEHFTMTTVALSLGNHAQTFVSNETWDPARDK